MIRFNELKGHVPTTRKMTQSALYGLLYTYGDVILKPSYGSRGRGIIRVAVAGEELYFIHFGRTKLYSRGRKWTYNKLLKLIGSDPYVIQRRIPLATVKDRPFDIRVVVQRRKNSNAWVVTGKVAKVAGEGYIVTNVTRSKGTVLPITVAIERSSFRNLSPGRLLSEIDRVALLTAVKMSRSKLYADKSIFGLDMGLDKYGRVWVIEVNLNPMLSHFQKLDDKTMYERIMKYKKG